MRDFVQNGVICILDSGGKPTMIVMGRVFLFDTNARVADTA
jgi:hypothetical protein